MKSDLKLNNMLDTGTKSHEISHQEVSRCFGVLPRRRDQWGRAIDEDSHSSAVLTLVETATGGIRKVDILTNSRDLVDAESERKTRKCLGWRVCHLQACMAKRKCVETIVKCVVEHEPRGFARNALYCPVSS